MLFFRVRSAGCAVGVLAHVSLQTDISTERLLALSVRTGVRFVPGVHSREPCCQRDFFSESLRICLRPMAGVFFQGVSALHVSDKSVFSRKFTGATLMRTRIRPVPGVCAQVCLHSGALGESPLTAFKCADVGLFPRVGAGMRYESGLLGKLSAASAFGTDIGLFLVVHAQMRFEHL